jgi:hypothetical protein
MSGAKRTFVFEPWSPEAPQPAPRNPSWLARKAFSTRPPSPRPPALPALPVIETSESFPAEHESAVLPKAEPPAPPPSVDLGMAAALAQLAEENAALRTKVAEMAASMARLRRDVLEASEPELVNLAMTISERVVARELATDPALVVAWAHEAIQTLAAQDEVVIALARDVAQQVPPDAWNAIEVEHRVTTDPLLPSGTIEVRTPEGAIVDGPRARLGAVSEALGLEAS